MRELPTGTVTFVFTEVEGSTELLRRVGKLGVRRAPRGARAARRRRRGLADTEIHWPVFERELDNFSATLDWLTHAGENESAVQLVCAITGLWETTGHHLERGRSWRGSTIPPWRRPSPQGRR